MSETLLTPVGRMIQGDLFIGSDTDFYGKPRTTKDGAPSLQFFAAIAIPKTDPSWGQFWGALQAEAQAGFPKGEWQWQGTDPQGNPNPNFIFAWKVEDGDGPKYIGKEGAAGCWVVKATSGFAPSVFTVDNQQILNPQEAGKGNYYQFAVSFKANGDAQKPGMFINLNMARRVGFGAPIQSGPDAATVFGAAPVNLPQGASATPIAPQTQMPAMNNQQGGGYQAPQQGGNYPAHQQNAPQQNAPGGYQDPNANPGYQQPAQQNNPGGYQNPNQQPAQQNNPGGYVDPNANNGYQQPAQHVDPNAGHPNNAPGYNTATMSHTNQPNQQQINPAGDFLNGPQ